MKDEQYIIFKYDERLKRTYYFERFLMGFASWTIKPETAKIFYSKRDARKVTRKLYNSNIMEK